MSCSFTTGHFHKPPVFFQSWKKLLQRFQLLSVFGSVHKSLWNPIQSSTSNSLGNEQKCFHSSTEKLFTESNEILMVWLKWTLVLGSTSVLTVITSNGHVSNSEPLRLVTEQKWESRIEGRIKSLPLPSEESHPRAKGYQHQPAS